jgi:hypothetical protein
MSQISDSNCCEMARNVSFADLKEVCLREWISASNRDASSCVAWKILNEAVVSHSHLNSSLAVSWYYQFISSGHSVFFELFIIVQLIKRLLVITCSKLPHLTQENMSRGPIMN